MPHAWEAHWALDAAHSREQRNWMVHGIGNLTLIGGKLNKELSHGPWTAPDDSPSKRKGLRDHSKLELNAHLLQDYPDRWGEDTMTARALILFDVARIIWPDAHMMTARAPAQVVQPVATVALGLSV